MIAGYHKLLHDQAAGKEMPKWENLFCCFHVLVKSFHINSFDCGLCNAEWDDKDGLSMELVWDNRIMRVKEKPEEGGRVAKWRKRREEGGERRERENEKKRFHLIRIYYKSNNFYANYEVLHL